MSEKKNIRVGLVKFRGKYINTGINNKEYAFYTKINDLKQNDLVVVQSKSDSELILASFVKYEKEDELPFAPTKWIIDKVNTEIQDEFAEKLKEIDKIKNKIASRERIYNQVSKRKLLALVDEEIKENLEKLHQLTGETNADLLEEIEKIRLKDVVNPIIK